MTIKSKYKDMIRSVLTMCGLSLDNRFNFICAQCMSNPVNDNFEKCKDEYNKRDVLAHFYCIINYYKCQDVRPPLEIEHTALIIDRILRYLMKYNEFPAPVINVPLTLRIKRNGELDIDKAANDYRVQILQILGRISGI